MTAVKSVLLVDDDAALLDALPSAIRLRLPGVEVETRDSASDALSCLEHRDFDAIVTDIKMPGMDGLSLLAAVRKLRPHTPTLLISGHGEHDLTIQALRGGAYDFIQKPIDREYFIAALRRAFDLRALQREVHRQQELLERHNRDLEETVERRTRDLRRATDAKDEFLGLISHEMRTPLTVLNGGVHLLVSGHLEKAQADGILGDMEREGARLLRIVEDLLALAHASLDDAVETEPLALNGLLRAVARRLEMRTNRTILLDVPKDVPFVHGNAGYVERIIENLVSNSMKYASPDCPIAVATSPAQPGFIALSVRDGGARITDAEAARMFDRFYRAKSTAGKVSGAGIGLTVCRRLVEALGGEIAAHPREGGGLEVRFTLPVFDAPVEQPLEEPLAARAQA